MVLTGNIICIILCVIETFAVSGLWFGWGQERGLNLLISFEYLNDFSFSTLD